MALGILIPVGSKRNAIIALVGVAAAAVVTVVVVGMAFGGDTSPATKAQYQKTVVNTRNRVDYALERIAESQSVDELINRLDEAGSLVGDAAGDLDHAPVPQGLDAENAALVRTLRSYSQSLSNTAATMQDPSFAGSLSGINSLSYPQWDTVNRILAKLKAQGVNVPPLYRHGGVE
jgi:hypothetical protein